MIPDDSIATRVTSARPIISADAVEAVRWGLRRALSRASLPMAPAILVAGHPSQFASTGTIRADSSAMPMNTSTAPRPISPSTPPVPLATNRPTSSDMKPSATAVAEAGLRYFANLPSGSVAPSRTAAIGSTRVARIAGRRLASIVTTTPTTIATMIVLGLDHRARVGQRQPGRVEEREQALREPQPHEQPDRRGDQPDHERLEHDRPPHLAAGGAERPQGPELPRPLGDRDRQRVGDHEAAHEQRDAREHEQERLQKREEAVDRRGVLLGLLGPGSDLRVGWQDRDGSAPPAAAG